MGPCDHCFLCSKKRSPNISLHRFPKDSRVRSAWIAFCNLSETDYVSTLNLCSSHFIPSDYIDVKARERGGVLKLKSGSVPSVTVKTEPGSLFENESDYVSTLNLCSSHFIPSDYIDVKARERGGVLKLKSGSVPSVTVKTEPVVVAEPSNSSHVVVEKGEQTPKKRRFAEPRYIGDISTPDDVSSPRRAKRTLLLAKTKIADQTKKIKLLQQRNRRLLKRINTLEDLISQQKKKNLNLK